jgi:hypothetical protein
VPGGGRLEHIEAGLFRILLIGAVGTSIVTNVVGVDPKWYLPGLFMAIYGLYRKLDSLPAARSDVETLLFQSNAEYYPHIQRRVSRASSSVWMTYMRVRPPSASASAEAGSYFRFTVDWAKQHPDCEFRRVFAASDDGPLTDWLLTHYRQNRSVKNYIPKVVPSASTIDSISLGIFDANAAVLVLPGEGGTLIGHCFQTAEAVQTFREWYLKLWSVAEPLEDYVKRVEARRAGQP